MVPIGTVVFSASNSKEMLISGIDTEQEIRTIRILLIAVLLSTAAAFVWALADYATLANKICTRVRISTDQDENAESLSPVEWRSDAIDSTGRDPWQEFLRVGDTIPAVGAPPGVTVKLPIDVNYLHEGLEVSNLLCISSDQLNAGAAKVAIDWQAAPGNVVYTNGTATTTLSDAKVQFDMGDAHMVFVGPHWTRKSKGATAVFDLEEYPSVELLLANESTPAALEALAAQVSVNVDDRLRPRNMPPTELAQMYGRQKVKIAGDLNAAIDVTNNALGGGTGSLLSPIRWINARVRSAEYEMPYFKRKRRVEFPSGSSIAYQFLRKATQHIARQKDLLAAIMGNAKVGGRPEDLRVRGFGGGDNDTLSEFKGRIVKLTGS